jgi:hypothetical protein
MYLWSPCFGRALASDPVNPTPITCRPASILTQLLTFPDTTDNFRFAEWSIVMRFGKAPTDLAQKSWGHGWRRPAPCPLRPACLWIARATEHQSTVSPDYRQERICEWPSGGIRPICALPCRAAGPWRPWSRARRPRGRCRTRRARRGASRAPAAV